MSAPLPLSKLSVLRKRLDLMGYHEPLPLEAVPLVAQLLSDFLQLTENFNNLKTEHTQLLKLKENFEDNVEPYKEENIRLIKENNELHQEIMKVKEKAERMLSDMKAKVKKIEDENSNLRFLNNQYIQKAQNFEKQSQEKSEIIRSLQEKHTSQVTVRKSSSLHRPLVEINTLPPSDEPFYHRLSEQVKDPQVDVSQLSAGTFLKMQKENQDLLEVIEQVQKSMESLEDKVSSRDKEIQRLTAQLNQGRPLHVISLETKERRKDDIIQNLQHQLESLYHQNEELEKIIIKYCGKEYLPEKLHPSGMLTSMDTGYATERLDISRKLEKPCSLDKPASQHDGVQSCETHVQNISRLEKALKLANLEKRKLGDKVTSLLANEKELQSELSKLKRKVSPHGASPPRQAERLARLIQVLEAQRDFFKEEYETVRRLQETSTKTTSKPQRKSLSDTKISESTSKGYEASRVTRERTFVHLIEEERDFYKEKYEKLLEKQEGSKEEKVDLSIPTADKAIMVFDNTLEKLRKENFELLQKVKDLEHQVHQFQMISSAPVPLESEKQKIERENLEKAVAQLQNSIEELQSKFETVSKEKQFFMQKYQQAVVENSQLRDAMSSEADHALDDILNMSRLRTQDIQDQVPNIYTDADVDAKIKEVEEQYKCKDIVLRQQIEQLQKVVADLKKDNDSCKDSLASHKATVSSLEHQISSLQYQLSQALDESDQHRTAAQQIRLMADYGEQSTEQLQLLLAQKQDQLDISERKIKTLESNIEELKDILKHHEREISDLRATAVTLEEDKEKQREAVSEKDLHLSSLQQQVYSKELHASQLKITVSALETELEKVQSEIRLKDKEISSVKQQLESKTQDVEETSHSLDVMRRENSRLLEEVSTLTKENQTITQELENRLEELDELKRKVAEYVTEVTRIQEVLSIKEQQRAEIIQQYRELSHENSHLETETRRLESEAAAVQMEVQAKDVELQNLHSTIQSLEHEIEEYMLAQESNRLEMTFLNSSVTGLEAELIQKQQETERLQAELSAARSLSVQMDASREQLQKMLADEGSTNAKLTSELEDLRDEVRALRAQLSSERSSVMNMESLMATHREKEFRSHLVNQELSAEVSLLRSRLHESAERMEAFTKELSSFKTKVAEIEMENAQLKRQITNEKYEREKDRNELLRLQHLQKLYVRESIERPVTTSQSAFKLPRTMSISSSSETETFSVAQQTAMSASSRRAYSAGFIAERSLSQPSLSHATTARQDILSSGQRQSLPKTTSLEHQERESPDDHAS